ncbi:DUF4282 domain-containing protein [Nocardia terpenica]|uniref:DUF4282 domain-containing protein n=1 Tax=Nocardia terpenica TaxID=455432 RepID=A0A164H8K3_9NOCA|nr:DUF4282 domain-containing protein [Nocardia terpenica]KZM68293.1 hypothetical protein AWN90_10365 [Nocardia terpenica]MBF6065060.1 DUF4282 domain-containing protein [Nocardia terpenica]MBF6108117.1 DUF4282 domain-containing protein [Nocardia terpenica]MBF6115332.1 DUF4282 domain-containing protein [Nocardia terpenica]MBF6122654.1 DUF4282 domain-containing protein [Nocardia terpenica]
MSEDPGGSGMGEDLGDFEVEPRWLAWREPASRRLSQHVGEREAQPPEPFRSPSAFAAWCVAALRALVDVQFRRPATSTLLPLAYLLGLAFAGGVPIVLTVLLWHLSMALGLVFALVVAVPLGLTIAAAVRLALEFLVNASRLASRVEHINDLADDLFRALSEVAEPVNQLSEDVRAVQFWRFRRRPPRK